MQWNLVFHDSYNDELNTCLSSSNTTDSGFSGNKGKRNHEMERSECYYVIKWWIFDDDDVTTNMSFWWDAIWYIHHFCCSLFFLPKKSSILMSYQAFKFNFPVCRILRGQRNMLSDTTNPESESNDRTIVFFTRSVLCEKRTMLHNKV